MTKMYEAYETLQNRVMEGVGPVADRVIDPHQNDDLPSGIDVISADNHWEITEDIFYENFPAHLKEQAPRVWFDGYWRIGRPGVKEAFGIGDIIEETLKKGFTPTAWSHESRQRDLAIDGMTKELVFPQSLLGYVDPDPEIREAIARVYNDYMAKQHRLNPHFFGVGLCSNWWDPSKVTGALQQLVDLGLKTYMMPIKLKGPDGKEMSYAAPFMEPFWAAASKTGLPVCLHVGEALKFDCRGALATGALDAFASFRSPMSQLVFGGVFDRYPDLQVVFAEGGISWVLSWLQDAEALYDTYGSLVDDEIAHRPSHYWRNNCYATFQADELGLAHIEVLGADRIMWAADYPHSEGTFGFSRQAMKVVVDMIGESDARLVLGENAKRVFGM